MKFPLYIAKRYLFSKGSANAINIITNISLVGIVIGALILTVVLSAFSGLKSLHVEFTSFVDPELKIFPKEGKFFSITEKQKQDLESIEGVVSFSEVVENQVFLDYKNKKHYAIVKGVDKSYKNVVATDSILGSGDWIFGNENYVVIGNEISNLLSLGVNNTINPLNLYMPKPGKGQITNLANAFKRKSVTVSGIYQLTNEMDDKYVFGDINLARNLLSLSPDKVSNIEFKLAPEANEKSIRNKISAILEDKVTIKNRIQLNEATYKMLKSENLMAYAVSTLVLIVALFNLVGAMIMMIIDKKKNLNTLFKLGATLKQIRLIFFFQGLLMTFLGGFIGIGLALILLKLQKTFGLIMITYSIPYPVQINPSNVLIVFSTLLVLGIFASIIASKSISKQKLG